MIDFNNMPKMEDVYPFIVESIKDGGQFVLFPRGTSMNPTIYEGKDCVALVEPKDIKIFDIALYKRESGQFVLHRIMKEENGKYTMCGDNQFIFEKGIGKEQIIAVVSEVRKADGSIIDREQIHKDGKRFLTMPKKRLLRLRRFIKILIKGE